MEGDTIQFDNEVLSFLSERKKTLIDEHRDYIANKPEIREVLNDFLSAVLLSKPVSATQVIYFESGRCLCVRKRIFPSIQPNSS